MKHDPEEDDLTRYLLGELDETAAREVESRLQRDPALGEQLRVLQATLEWLKADRDRLTAPTLCAAQRAALQAAARGEHRPRRRPARRLFVLVAAVLVLGGLLALRNALLVPPSAASIEVEPIAAAPAAAAEPAPVPVPFDPVNAAFRFYDASSPPSAETFLRTVEELRTVLSVADPAAAQQVPGDAFVGFMETTRAAPEAAPAPVETSTTPSPSVLRRSRGVPETESRVALPEEAVTWIADFSVELAQGAARLDDDSLAVEIPSDPALRVRALLEQLARRPGETPQMMFFRFWGDNGSVETSQDPLSTFSLDVDTASYTLARQYLARGVLPDKAAVRTEEFVNYFRHDLAPPPTGRSLALHAELAASPFASPGTQLLQVGIKAREVPDAERPPVSLTFVIDVSGSMKQENRLGLVQNALRLLVDQLEERDTIGIVTFRDQAAAVLQPHSLAHRPVVRAAIDSLQADGSTNAGDGLLMGYQMALAQFREGAQNRVILCSDGVANTGVTDVDGILGQVQKYREAEIFLHTVGVGMGNHNDALLEQLADRGDGFCVYVDRIEEARRVLVDRLRSTLITVARDAKVQVSFDPAQVARYRLLGYENRALRDQDFRDDRVDAGEVGAGHEVIALYEIVPREGAEGPVATVRARYRDIAAQEVVEQEVVVRAEQAAPGFAAAPPRFRLSACVAEFAELLRRSVWAREGSIAAVLEQAEPLVHELPGDADVLEFVALLHQAERLLVAPEEPDEFTRSIEAIKRNRHLRARIEDLAATGIREELEELERENARLEQRLQELLDRRPPER